jgi:hypothetical protein
VLMSVIWSTSKVSLVAVVLARRHLDNLVSEFYIGTIACLLASGDDAATFEICTW